MSRVVILVNKLLLKNLEVKPRKLPFESEDARRLNEVGLMFKQLKIPTWQRFLFSKDSLDFSDFFCVIIFWEAKSTDLQQKSTEKRWQSFHPPTAEKGGGVGKSDPNMIRPYKLVKYRRLHEKASMTFLQHSRLKKHQLEAKIG